MKIVALAGGVGGAKLLWGLARVVPARDLTIVVNTGDDFDWLGLRVCPDLDTVLYTLAGLAHPGTGWGVRDDTFSTLHRIEQLGGPAWFRIGDRDLATHILRTEALRSGRTLTEVIAGLCRSNGVEPRVLPMSDDPVPTRVHTDAGILPFQEYFVRRRAAPRVSGFTFEGIESARPAPGVLEAIAQADAVLLCPSNPFISINPILGVPGIRPALRAVRERTTAVTPIVQGVALKGPAAAMLDQLGLETSPVGVARLYGDIVRRFVLDRRDEGLAAAVAALGMEPHCRETVMESDESKVELARAVVELMP
jgi:LPPG:FO 2-phospho-L-lactate transferase